MPFKSKAQARWMFATHPKMAKKWAKHTGDMKGLPDKKHEGRYMSVWEQLNEALNPGQLHDPKDFVQKLRELAGETASHCAALEQFVEAHRGDPEWANIQVDELSDELGKITDGATALAQFVGPIEQALLKQDQAEDEAKEAKKQAKASPGTTFKKV